jgi:hypothetical protein
VLKNVCSRIEKCKLFSQQELLHTINKQLREEAMNNPMYVTLPTGIIRLPNHQVKPVDLGITFQVAG